MEIEKKTCANCGAPVLVTDLDSPGWSQFFDDREPELMVLSGLGWMGIGKALVLGVTAHKCKGKNANESP